MVDLVAVEALDSGDKAVFLNVNKQNEGAIDFYKKHQFSLIKKEEIDIGNGFIMDDFVFELELTQSNINNIK